MHSLLIGFYSVGKALKLTFFYNLLPDVDMLTGLVYKANTCFIPVFCFGIL